MLYFLILFLSALLLFIQVRSISEDHQCSNFLFGSEGSPFNSVPLELGEKFTWEFPLLYIDRRRGLQNIEEYQNETENTAKTEIGTWHGYCVGLGINDPNYDQICHHVYTYVDSSGSGIFTGASRYNTNDEVMMVAITGGTGLLFDASGDINVTHANDVYLHDIMLCYD
jgi:hypothetical protein